MRIAAFDLGSNSFHMILVETRPDGSFVPIAKEREMLRLGDLVAKTGELGTEGRERAFEVIRRFKTIADTHEADQIVAVGTSALREAHDGPEFVDSVRRKLGLTIHIIDGIQEATAIFNAIRASVVLDPAPALALDLGGGSLELMLGDTAGLAFAASVKLGVGRLTSMFFESDPPVESELSEARRYIEQELEPVLSELAEFGPRLLIGSSGTFIAIAAIAATMRDGSEPDHLNHLTVSYEDVVSASKRVLTETKANRAKIRGTDARRAELLPAGFLVLIHIMERLGMHEITISGWALREGLILRTIAEHDPTDFGDDPRSIRRSSVLSLCHRCNWNRDHSVQVAELATQIFDATMVLHEMSARERELLEFGALMHDLGEHISRTNHDRHSAYLITNGDLRGFTPKEVRILTMLARYHLRGSEKSVAKDPVLNSVELEHLLKLIGILRIADAFDASHSGEVMKVEVCELLGRRVLFSLAVKNEAELELWSMHRKKQLFERVFDVECETRLERSRMSKLTALLASDIGLS